MLDDNGEVSVSEGDEIEARVISVEGGQVKLGKAIGADSAKNCLDALPLSIEQPKLTPTKAYYEPFLGSLGCLPWMLHAVGAATAMHAQAIACVAVSALI